MKPKKNLYEIFSGEELAIAQKIQQRRLQVLVHSYIYYERDMNIISDHQWSEWAFELAELQKQYPKIARRVVYAKMFKDFDGSSGAFFKYDIDTITLAERLIEKYT